MKKLQGVRQRSKTSYEINFRPHKGADSVWVNVKAASPQEACLKRAQLMVEASAKPSSLDFSEGIAREKMTFEAIWPVLEENIKADGKTHKTLLGLKKVYNRMFTEFRLKRYPSLLSPAQLSLPFFVEYKSFYGVGMGRERGLRAEIQRVKMIVYRLRRLRYISAEFMKEFTEPRAFQTPKIGGKKNYVNLTNTELKAYFIEMKKERPDIYYPAYFMLRTGRRVEETTLIERNDVQWAGLKLTKIDIRAETTKTDTPAPLSYIDEDLTSHIRQAYQRGADRKAPYLFLNQQFKKINQRMVTRYLGELSERLFQVRITSHWFRHHFFTETCKARLPLVDIQAISGLRDVKILVKYYCHDSSDGQAAVLEKTRLI